MNFSHPGVFACIPMILTIPVEGERARDAANAKVLCTNVLIILQLRMIFRIQYISIRSSYLWILIYDVMLTVCVW